MKLPSLLPKLAAVVSSILLVSGFVSYRAGAFDWLVDRSATPVETEASPTVGDNLISIEVHPSIYLMSGSKSDRMVLPSTDQPAAKTQEPSSQTAPPVPTILPGSKYIAPMIGPATSK